MTKTAKTSKNARAAAPVAKLTLDTFEAALIAEGMADANVLAHFKAFGRNEDFQARFRVVELAKYLVKFAIAGDIAGGKGYAAEILSRAKKARDERENKAVNAVNNRWSYWLARAGIGGNVKGKTKGAAQRKTAPVAGSKGANAARDAVKVAPKVKTAADLDAYARIQAAALLATFNANAKIGELSEMRALVAKFAADVAKVAKPE